MGVMRTSAPVFSPLEARGQGRHVLEPRQRPLAGIQLIGRDRGALLVDEVDHVHGRVEAEVPRPLPRGRVEPPARRVRGQAAGLGVEEQLVDQVGPGRVGHEGEAVAGVDLDRVGALGGLDGHHRRRADGAVAADRMDRGHAGPVVGAEQEAAAGVGGDVARVRLQRRGAEGARAARCPCPGGRRRPGGRCAGRRRGTAAADRRTGGRGRRRRRRWRRSRGPPSRGPWSRR